MSGSISSTALKDELIRRRLIEPASGDMPAVIHDRPWFISIVLGASGWLAGIFVLVFVAALFEPDSPGGIALCGVVLLSAAFGLYAVDRNSEFFDQLALALSIAGQFAMVWAAYDATESDTGTAALTCVMEVVLLLVMRNRVAKVLAVFFACCAWALTIRFGWWGEEPDAVRHVSVGPALLGWFAVWLPVIGAVHALVRTESTWMAGAVQPIARAALIGLLVSLSLATWLSEPFDSLLFWDEQRHADWRALWPLLGAIGALIAAVYSFRIRSRVLMGIAAVGALLHVGQFYYLLGVTLLMKSFIMLALGGLALLAAAWLQGHGSRRGDET